MTLDYYRSLFEYNRITNLKLVEFLEQMKDSSKGYLLLCHIQNAQELWLARIENRKSEVNIWDVRSYQDFKLIEEKFYQKWKNFLSTLKDSDLTQKINYKSLEGNIFGNLHQKVQF